MELTPGANMGYLAALSLVGGRRGGVMAAAGVATAFAVALAVALIAATELEPYIDVGSQILQAIGSLYFLWLAVDTWRAGDRAPQQEDSPTVSGAHTFLRSLLANLVSPKTWIFYLAVVPSFAGHVPRPAVIATLGVTHIVIATLVHLGIVTAARASHGFFEGPSHRLRTLMRLFAAGLLFLALWFAADALNLV
jgi:threonine/homoserine/homoserine lactone efflux protein